MGARKLFPAVQPWVSLVVAYRRRRHHGVGWHRQADRHPCLRARRQRVRTRSPRGSSRWWATSCPTSRSPLASCSSRGSSPGAPPIVYLALLVVYVSGTIWAWTHHLQIDCGCFGGDGSLAEGQTTNYAAHFIERAEFIALGVWLFFFPRSRLSVDGWLSPTK